MDNIQLYHIDNEINKVDEMKEGDVIYKNGVELLVVLSYDHNEPCKGCFFYEDKACGSEKLIKCWDCKVDNLTIPYGKWRKESIKAYGNAIVPLIAVKIFEMINKIERYEQQTTL